MSKDFAFLFKPGDYLRDTQCLSEKVQVAYDRIMCEHMRNICISQQQLNFFTKRLSEGEKEEIMLVLKQIEGGFEIEWVAESIRERIAYSNSRRLNREGKTKEHMINISKTYDKHMEGEDENEDDIKDVIKFYNESTSLPKILKLTENRKKHLRARIKEHGSAKVIEMITTADRSDFLHGRNDRNWKADFDWLMKPDNFMKVIEGKYENKKEKLAV